MWQVIAGPRLEGLECGPGLRAGREALQVRADARGRALQRADVQLRERAVPPAGVQRLPLRGRAPQALQQRQVLRTRAAGRAPAPGGCLLSGQRGAEPRAVAVCARSWCGGGLMPKMPRPVRSSAACSAAARMAAPALRTNSSASAGAVFYVPRPASAGPARAAPGGPGQRARPRVRAEGLQVQ